MSRLSRYTQLLFGSSAGTNQMAEFGSFAAGTPARYNGSTITPAIIQTLSQYLGGWLSAVVGANSPAIEDMNALCYLFAYQLAYLLQAGVPEWDSGTTYYTGDIVQSAGVCYVSLIDSNLNNAVTNTTDWRSFYRLTTATSSSPQSVGGATAVTTSTGADEDIYVAGSGAWTSSSLAEANSWSSIVWSPSLQLFVTVGAAGTHRVATSPDGITWTMRTAAEADPWTSVCWSPQLNLFVAVAGSGTNVVMTSPDGVTWTSRTPAETNLWSCVIWVEQLSLFVAVAATGTHRVMTSPDGTTWTLRTAAAANSWRSVCWSPYLRQLVAVASDGTVGTQVMTSPDGITWTSQTAAGNYNWESVDWSPSLGLYVAVNAGSVVGGGSTTNTIAYSKDGCYWVSVVLNAAPIFVKWIDDLGVFAITSLDFVYTSPDAINWTDQGSSGLAISSVQCEYSPDLRTFIFTSAGTSFGRITVPIITANPQIGTSGAIRGKRATLNGTGDLKGAVFLQPGNGLSMRKKSILGNGISMPFVWDDVNSLWRQVI